LKPKSENILFLGGRLWPHINQGRRKQLYIVIVLMIIVSLAEVVSLGAILPFLGAVTDPDSLFKKPLLQTYIYAFNINSPRELLFALTLVFCCCVFFAGTMRILLAWASNHLAFNIGADLSIEIYRRTLYQPYSVHIERNSSDVIAGILSKVHEVIYNVLIPFVTLLSSGILIFVISSILFLINPFVATITFGGFGLIYILIALATKKRLLLNSRRISDQSNLVIKALQEGLGGIRDILLDGTQETFCKVYREADALLRDAQGSNQLISQMPRYVMESLGMILIAILAYFLSGRDGGSKEVIPILGLLALGSQRLLPLLQQVYTSWSNLRGATKSLQDVLFLLSQSLLAINHENTKEQITFQSKISLKNLSYRYNLNAPWVFKGLNLTINKGGRIGFIGASGSGKSTLVDVIMGLLPASEGFFSVDGRAITTENCQLWRACIAHVPQTIFLTDDSIAENIAFGVPKAEIDFELVRNAAKKAQISELIESWQDGYSTKVGERGVRLSGGQRQRVGIARALYKKATVIIFDEATSALDGETEASLMGAIDNLSSDLTILIVAHRLTTLRNCNSIIELSVGGLVRVGSYDDIVRNGI